MIERSRISAIYDGYNVKKLFRHALIDKDMGVTSLVQEEHSRRGGLYDDISDFSTIFFPIPVNPSYPDRTRFIIDTFVFGNEDDKATGEDLQRRSSSINYNSETLKRFVSVVMDQAERLDRSFDDVTTTKTQSVPFYQIVEGTKGVGKTHLQNYILSKYSEEFDRRKILWTRINLVRNFSASGGNSILNWAKCQIAKILLRYYDPASEYFAKDADSNPMVHDWRPDLVKFIKRSYEEDIDVFKSSYTDLVTFMNRLQKKESDQDIDPSWMRQDIVDEIFRIARSDLNITIILVIDGLDLLTETRAAKRKYTNRVEALENFLSSETPVRMYSLVFLRPKTIETFSDTLDFNQSSPMHHFDTKEHRSTVCSCSIETLFRKRMQHLARSDAVIKIETKRLESFDDFVKHELSDVVNRHGTKLTWMQLIQDLAKDNARTATQVLSSLPNSFEEKSHGDRRKEIRYKFIELAMLGRRHYPARTYSYTREGLVWQRDLDDVGHIYDTMFLPAIFSFPYERDAKASQLFGDLSFAKYIWGVRALQVVSRYTQTNKRRIGVQHVCEFLEIAFGYDLLTSKAIMEEYSEAEVVDIKADVRRMNGFDIFGYSCRLTNKGARILNSFLSDISYYTMNSFVVPLPKKIVEDSAKPRSAFQISSPKSGSFPDWIVTKIVNGLSMLKMISLANSFQRELALANRPLILDRLVEPSFDSSWGEIISDFMVDDGWFFSTVSKMESDVINSAVRTINGIDQEDLRSSITRKIVRYLG